MRETKISIPELVLVAGTRALLGAGIGLLLAERFGPGERKAVGWTLFLIGAATTIPLAFEVLGGQRLSSSTAMPMEQLRGETRLTTSDRFGPARVSVP